MPNVVLEAFAAGVPVVSTTAGGAPEVVEQGLSGFLVQPGDALRPRVRSVHRRVAPAIAAARRPIVVFRGYYGPAFYGPAWYGWYGPGWVAPYGYVPGPSGGSVKIDSRMKDAAVYVDGGYAGTVGRLKTFTLRPGTHDLELRDPSGHSFYQERIEVIAGKTIKISPDYRG